MPRTKRIIPPQAALHVMCRGNNKQDILSADRDKIQYYSLLTEYKAENKIEIFHYCIMHNHVHLIVWLNPESRLARFMKQVNLGYFHYYRRTYEYCGHLWQGRFKDKIIDDDAYLLQCGKYIELNPVRKGIISRPEKYAFSSYNHYAKNKRDPIITDSPAYSAMDNSEAGRRKTYANFVVKQKGDASPGGEASP